VGFASQTRGATIRVASLFRDFLPRFTLFVKFPRLFLFGVSRVTRGANASTTSVGALVVLAGEMLFNGLKNNEVGRLSCEL
jgi:hypothetical protein